MSPRATERAGLVTLPVNGAWQATTADTGRTGDFYAFTSRYVVDTYERSVSAEPVTHSGRWFEADGARRYAASCGGEAVVREVPEYWYAPAFGATDDRPVREVEATTEKAARLGWIGGAR